RDPGKTAAVLRPDRDVDRHGAAVEQDLEPRSRLLARCAGPRRAHHALRRGGGQRAGGAAFGAAPIGGGPAGDPDAPHRRMGAAAAARRSRRHRRSAAPNRGQRGARARWPRSARAGESAAAALISVKRKIHFRAPHANVQPRAFAPAPLRLSAPPPGAPSPAAVAAPQAPASPELWRKMGGEFLAAVKAAGLADDVTVESMPDELVISLRDTIPFASGKADLRPRALPVLEKVVALILRDNSLSVAIGGHTDSLRIATPEFP